MCSSTAYFKKNGDEEMLITEVMYLKPEGNGYRLMAMLGDEKLVENAQLLEVDFERNRIVLGPAAK